MEKAHQAAPQASHGLRTPFQLGLNVPHKLVLHMAIQLLPPKATSMASFSMVAQCVGYKPHRLIFAIGDAHLYRNHEAQAQLQLSRTPYPFLAWNSTPTSGK
jgi:hypothetical protein